MVGIGRVTEGGPVEEPVIEPSIEGEAPTVENSEIESERPPERPSILRPQPSPEVPTVVPSENLKGESVATTENALPIEALIEDPNTDPLTMQQIMGSSMRNNGEND